MRAATAGLLAAPSREGVLRLRAALERSLEVRSQAGDLALARQLRRAREALGALSTSLRTHDGEAPPPPASRRGAAPSAAATEPQDRWASRLDRPDAPRLGSAESLAALARRVARGDRTPETLARLHRELVVAGAPGPPPGGDRGRSRTLAGAARGRATPGGSSRPPPPRPRTLADPRRGRRRSPGSPRPPGARAAVAGYQRAASDLAAHAGRPGHWRPRTLLAAARLRGEPERAVAAWAAHASARGASAREVAHGLARAGQGAALAVPHPLRAPGAAVVAEAARLGVDHALHRTAFRLEQRLVRGVQREVLGASAFRNYTRAMTVTTTFRQIYDIAMAPSATAAAFAAARLGYSLGRRFVLGRTRER